jgi:AraC-like DNA-binding protein
MLVVSDTEDTNQAGTAWVSIRHLQRLAAYMAMRGADCDAWLMQAGIAPACLNDGDGRVSLAAIERLLGIVQQSFDEPSLGLELARTISPASFGVLGHLFQASGTLGDLMASMVRFNGLMSNVGLSSMRHGPGTVTMSWACLAGGPAFRTLAAEFILGACSVMTRTLAPNLRRPVVIRFQHAAANDRAHAVLTRYFECPVHMQQPDNAIVLPASYLSCKLPHGDAELKAVLEQRALALLASRAQRPSMLDEVKRHIRIVMARGAPIIRQDVAKRLGLSESTLHRRLQDQGTSFQDLVDAVRLQMATHTLAQGSVSASMIANRLGFSSPQVFTRWFRQQTGLTPGSYREQAVVRRDVPAS